MVNSYKHHYVYKTTNKKTGEFYIGKRSCDCEINKDDYMGSGIKIQEQIESIGLKNFKKDILAICRNNEELTLVESAFIKMNLHYPKNLNINRGVKVKDFNLYKKLEHDVRKYKTKVRELRAEKNEKMFVYKDRVEYVDRPTRKRNALSRALNNMIKEEKNQNIQC